tara:strand:+ start:175 stop:792 length:618 start_codon:yes stop_codon:yes gene_type:complete
LSEEKDLWETVRQMISDSEEKPEDEIPKIMADENVLVEEKEHEPVKKIKKEIEGSVKEPILSSDFATINLLNEGVFAGFLYIFVIMIVLGLLSLPGSITAAVGGFFGGKKAGDPARALTAAMLPFLIIASIYFLASTGALPPGSGPNDVATEISEIIGHNPNDDSLGPISKMPDSTSSVFVSVVTFAFIGGLSNIDNKKQTALRN